MKLCIHAPHTHDEQLCQTTHGGQTPLLGLNRIAVEPYGGSAPSVRAVAEWKLERFNSNIPVPTDNAKNQVNAVIEAGLGPVLFIYFDDADKGYFVQRRNASSCLILQLNFTFKYYILRFHLFLSKGCPCSVTTSYKNVILECFGARPKRHGFRPGSAPLGAVGDCTFKRAFKITRAHTHTHSAVCVYRI